VKFFISSPVHVTPKATFEFQFFLSSEIRYIMSYSSLAEVWKFKFMVIRVFFFYRASFFPFLKWKFTFPLGHLGTIDIACLHQTQIKYRSLKWNIFKMLDLKANYWSFFHRSVQFSTIHNASVWIFTTNDLYQLLSFQSSCSWKDRRKCKFFSLGKILL